MASYEGTKYRLRAASPIPTEQEGVFKLHTFMAELIDSDIETCTTNLLSSYDFRGQGGSYISASYSRLPLAGGDHFREETASNTRFVDEGDF